MVFNNSCWVTSELDRLKTLKKNWDGYGSKKLKITSIRNARKFLNSICEKYRTPLLTGDSDGNVCCEWWSCEKKLSIYITSKEISYVTSYNANINDMEYGTINNLENFKTLWAWLND